MNLDLFNNIIKSTKENNIIDNFIKELNKIIDQKTFNIEKNVPKEYSLLQKAQENKNITTETRDKMHLERSKILKQYAKETEAEGDLYYIYSKKNNENIYLVSKQGEERNIIELERSELPKGAKVDSILRTKNGKYTLDEQGTKEISNQINKMIDKLLEEQSHDLEEKRIEGNLYEVIENSSNIVSLIDITEDSKNGECFEEINISNEVIEQIAEGTILQYINGKYQIQKK